MQNPTSRGRAHSHKRSQHYVKIPALPVRWDGNDSRRCDHYRRKGFAACLHKSDMRLGLDCGVPVPFSQFHKGLPMCGGKGGSGTLHKISAAAGPSSDGGLLAVWAFLGSVLP